MACRTAGSESMTSISTPVRSKAVVCSTAVFADADLEQKMRNPANWAAQVDPEAGPVIVAVK